MRYSILIVEDDEFQRTTLKRMLKRQFDCDIQEAASGKEALEVLKRQQSVPIATSLVILDLGLPDMHGLEVLAIIKQHFPNLPVIILTGSDDIDNAVSALKKGAVDFLNKPPEINRISVSIKNALKLNSLSKEVSRLRRKDKGEMQFHDLIGCDNGLAQTVAIGRKAATSDIPVLISGETGVGKELFARAIHGESQRTGNPFIAVNCGAIPEQLVESTLFGHEKGAFTGAISKTSGKFREAHGGTIFLDEVGELPPDTQVKLLRVLQQKEVEPVGSSKSHPVDVRIISATNRNLPDEVQAGCFREDLFFRLDGLPINIPALRARREDIPLLADHFLEYFSVKENLSLKQVSEMALEILVAHKWPGNIRELENLLHRAIVLSDHTILTEEDISSVMSHVGAISGDKEGNSAQSISVIFPDSSVASLATIEEQAIKMVMEFHNNNITQSCRSLGIAKSTFYRKWTKLKNT